MLDVTAATFRMVGVLAIYIVLLVRDIREEEEKKGEERTAWSFTNGSQGFAFV